NCRSASTRTTGRLVFLASSTARLEAMTDLPAPPLVENTVMTRPGAAVAPVSGSDATWRTGMALSVSATRSTASISCAGSVGEAGPELGIVVDDGDQEGGRAGVGHRHDRDPLALVGREAALEQLAVANRRDVSRLVVGRHECEVQAAVGVGRGPDDPLRGRG